MDGYAYAVGLLPQAAWPGLVRATQQEQLAQWAGLAADAAACAVLAGHPGRAVELLEQGRSVLWTQALNLRSDLTRLAEKAPELAGRLDAPGTDLLPLESADGTLAPDRARQRDVSADLRRRKAREWDEVLAQVRAVDGFEHFLTAVPYSELSAAAAGATVVIVNASTYGCHALIVDADGDQPRVVELPRMSLNAAAASAEAMLRAVTGLGVADRPFPDREKDRHAILDVLSWLWDVAAEPVLAALGHTSAPGADGAWPRVWWCLTGPLSILPVHAAGHYPRHRTSHQDMDSVLDRVVSSYTPTLTALTRSRQQLAPQPVRHVSVGVTAAPGLPPLSAVTAELAVLSRYFPPDRAHLQLAESQATRAAALAALSACSWAHLACHAGQQHAEPDRSGFALWDGTLTLTDLAAQPAQRREVAFLSACQTATGSIRHLDEAIHLAAAMQFLGYRHVIATMWTISDSLAPCVADTFYSTLTNGDGLDPDRAPEALHYATRSLRQSDPTNPLLWAPYVHFGA